MISGRCSVALLSHVGHSSLWGNATGFMGRRSALYLCYIQSNSDQRRFCSKWKPGECFRIERSWFSSPWSLFPKALQAVLTPEYGQLGFRGHRACIRILDWTLENARRKDFESLSGKLTPEALEQVRSMSDIFTSQEIERLFSSFPSALSPIFMNSVPIECVKVGNEVMVSMLTARIAMDTMETGEMLLGHFGTVISIPEDSCSTSTESWRVIYFHRGKEWLDMSK